MKKFLTLLLGIALVYSCSTSEDGNGNSTTTVVPVAPSNLTGTVASTTQINLSWTDNSTNETGFKIERKTGSGTYAVIGTTATDVTSYNDTGLTPSTSYTYRVYSNNTVGNSLTYSNEITLTTSSAITLPSITTTVISSITTTTAISGGNISSDGGANITARGVCWSTSVNPTIALTTKTNNGSLTGAFSSNITGLMANTNYYLRAYATNSAGTSYGNEISFITSQSVILTYPLGTVHCNPNNPTAIIDVINPITGKTWMDRNLGASQVATSSTDALAYGDLYQWGRKADGHQCRNSSTTSNLSSSNQPSHGNFILAPTQPLDWLSTQNDNLWQGVSGINNPCPSGYRLPTVIELMDERNSWGLSNYNPTGAFSSPLKLVLAGYRSYNGILSNEGGMVQYSSSDISTTSTGKIRSLQIESGVGTAGIMNTTPRAQGSSVRCIKN